MAQLAESFRLGRTQRNPRQSASETGRMDERTGGSWSSDRTGRSRAPDTRPEKKTEGKGKRIDSCSLLCGIAFCFLFQSFSRPELPVPRDERNAFVLSHFQAKRRRISAPPSGRFSNKASPPWSDMVDRTKLSPIPDPFRPVTSFLRE